MQSFGMHFTHGMSDWATVLLTRWNYSEVLQIHRDGKRATAPESFGITPSKYMKGLNFLHQRDE